jgi:hypothetical protein
MDRGQASDREPGADRDHGAAQAGRQADPASAHDPDWSAWDNQIQWDEWPAQQPAVGPWPKPQFDLNRIRPENIRVRLYSAREPQPGREPDPNRPGYYKDGWLIAVRDRYDRIVAEERAERARTARDQGPRWGADPNQRPSRQDLDGPRVVWGPDGLRLYPPRRSWRWWSRWRGHVGSWCWRRARRWWP